jgi:D-glycero-alpha-D-manno-heptose-7-phosphate kinase
MIVTRAPFRISLGGGGTDLPSYANEYGGFILSAAIDKYLFIHLNRLKIEDFILVKYSRTEKVERPEQIEHPLIREAMLLTETPGQLELAAMADVPAGSGLGSSGSFLVALLLALHTNKREQIPTQALAEEACHIEIDLVGQPVGKHDQYIAAFGGLTCLDIDRAGQVTVTPLRISAHATDQLRHNLLLFYTGKLRRSFDILDQQQNDTRTGNEEVIESLHRTKELGLQIRKALESEDLDRFGELLDEHWENKKRRSTQISDERVNNIYEVAKRSGALGGKIIGAGGGGFLLLYTPPEAKGAVRHAVGSEGLREMTFNFDFEGAKVIANLG